jgi:hypothetical protein
MWYHENMPLKVLLDASVPPIAFEMCWGPRKRCVALSNTHDVGE